jgi:hypothetical protein
MAVAYHNVRTFQRLVWSYDYSYGAAQAPFEQEWKS